MLTVCPKCTLTLAVTAADLRVGQGYVRCGRCATVFNALLALSDASTLDFSGTQGNLGVLAKTAAEPASEATAAKASTTATVSVIAGPELPRPEPAASVAAPAPTPQPAPLVTVTIEPATEEALDFGIDLTLASAPLDMVLEQTDPVAAPTRRVAARKAPEARPAPPAAAPISSVRTFSQEAGLEATSTVHTIVLEGSSVSQSEEFVDIDTIDSEIAAATRRALEVEARRSIASLDQDAGLAESQSASFAGGSPASPEPVETRLSESGSVYVHDRNSLYAPRKPPPKPPPSRLLWGTYAALLALILGAQSIHYWRNDLALRNDWIAFTLTHVYGVLALPLTPNWDLRGYDVRQLGAATNGSGDNAIRVRISLTNRARRAQPYPVLRLSLYDRYGKRVAARDLQPRDYLPKDRASGFMPAAQQIDSEVAVMDPGPDASSFELDVCIPGQRGLRCAGDTPLRPTAHS